MIFEKCFQFLIIKRILIISETENIWIMCQNDFIWIRKWSEHDYIWETRPKNVFDTSFFWITCFLSFDSFNCLTTSYDSDQSISELLCFPQIVFMTWMKSIKCPKCHDKHILLMVCFCLLYIHSMCWGFFLSGNFFFVVSIELEKFFFKYFLKKCLLWTNQQVNKDTKWRQKEDNQNTKNLQKHWTRPITDILRNPHHNTKPNNEYIEHYSPKHHIDIKLSKSSNNRGWIHETDYKKNVTIAKQNKKFYFEKIWLQLGFNEVQRIISFLTKICSSLYFIFLISCSRRFFLTILFMPLIAYNSGCLIYTPETLTEAQKNDFLIREISERSLHILRTLPSENFRIGKNVQETVENILSQEDNSTEKAA